MKKIYIFILMAVFLISSVYASVDDLTPVKQNDCITIAQTCATCSYVNISSISNRNNANLTTNVEMTSFGNGEWRYDFCGTTYLGRHDVKGMGDVNGVDSSFAVYFEVTPSGFIDTLGLYLIFLIVLGGIIILGFSISEVWFVVIGGLGLIMLGIYSINYGVVGFKDMFMTWGVGLFEIAVGAILSIGAGIQKMYYD